MALQNLLGNLALDSTSQEILAEVQLQQKDALTDTQLRAAPVPVSGTVSLDEASLIALENVTVNVEAGASVGVNNFPAVYPLPAEQVQVDALTNAQLRASPVPVGDDYASGELLEDQVGANNVLVFTFSQPVASFWVAPQGLSGTCKIDHYGGEPSATRGIPVDAGGALPIPEPATVVRVFTPTGLRVTVWGQRRG